MVRLFDLSKSQDIDEISDHTAQSPDVFSSDEESNQPSGTASKRGISGMKAAISNATKRFHHGIWIEPPVKECDLDWRPTDEQLLFANEIGWGESAVSQSVEKKMWRLLPKEVRETENTEVKKKTTMRKRKAMSIPAPDSTEETPESTGRRSQRVRKKVTTYNDMSLARIAVSFPNEYQSDSGAPEDTARQQKSASKQPQIAMEDQVSSLVRSEAESSGREPEIIGRRSRRARRWPKLIIPRF
ncbi:uncharacterized protein EAF01_011858 [Botrytis porri]|uniref:Uncharacterized protein n=1 Tax=Botrytis porri TaxID=87229 RepID=A0A4Z1KCL1_9HELO|nr:uncharacterized protein EAF01_011858 [Botrytis porri]KAF7881347.1 hypothetical protein EAF01_011858 [Botrytis porri]TGO83380.1 hypothetical protein BPOR_0656g00030 [Botrytis porri]